MRTVSDFPCEICEIANTWIEMRDGVRLAARIWLPADAERRPVPAILEYIPYRKRDLRTPEDSIMHPYFAGHGYAAVRVDLRGSGDSEGVLKDEYLQQEHDDGLAVLRWLAEQPWCDGNVGMIGISWGGFNGLQIAARRPPELKAIISCCSTDDRYADDIHHMGGCLLGDNLSWASTMFALNATPPDPELVGERWREMWRQRLQGSGLWLEQWLSHQRRDAYWQHGSVCEDFSAIQCPVMAVSGWADGYSNAVFRLLANLEVPRKGLIGPWSHKYPHLGEPGPAIGFLQECLRWWDQWLKEQDRGIMREPMLRVWMQDSVRPQPRYTERPGHWVAEREWPSPNIVERAYVLGVSRLLPAGSEVDPIGETVQSPLSLGTSAGKWCSYAAGPDLPYDQRIDDGGALVYDSAVLDEPFEILGAPVVELDIAADRPIAMVAVRLSDVAPDGKATRVTYGLLNLTHRNSSERPEPLEPGRRYRIRVQLNDIAQTFPVGNYLRLSISSSYWPLAWPPPAPVRLTVYTGTSALYLPERPASSQDAELREFEPPEGARPQRYTIIEPEHHNWWVIHDLASDRYTLEVANAPGVFRIEDIDLEVEETANEWYTHVGDDFESVRGETRWRHRFRRGDWQVRTETRTVLTSTPTHFEIAADLDAYEGDKRIYSRSWDTQIPRDHV